MRGTPGRALAHGRVKQRKQLVGRAPQEAPTRLSRIRPFVPAAFALGGAFARGFGRALAGNAQRVVAVAALLFIANAGTAFGQTCGTTQWDLWAGQTKDVGTLTVENDAANIYVTFALDDPDFPDATFGTLHLWIGNDLTNLPVSGGGNPQPGTLPSLARSNYTLS
jgi:hypothetical protein